MTRLWALVWAPALAALALGALVVLGVLFVKAVDLFKRVYGDAGAGE